MQEFNVDPSLKKQSQPAFISKIKSEKTVTENVNLCGRRFSGRVGFISEPVNRKFRKKSDPVKTDYKKARWQQNECIR